MRKEDSPTTRLSLLVRLRDVKDEQAWAEFVDIYAPLVYGLARRCGLQDADAADVTQEVLRSVVGTAARFRYDPARGTFRGWLFTVARNRVRKFLQVQGRQAQGVGGDAAQQVLEQQQADREETDYWDREYHRRLFEAAAARVRSAFRETTWQAFWRTAVEGHDPQQVGADLDLSVGAVYIARSRVMARIREQVRELQGE